MNNETFSDLHPDDTRDNDIKKEVNIKPEYEEVAGIEHSIEWKNGVGDGVTDDVYNGETNIEEIYIKSEPRDISGCEEDEVENAAVAKTENCDTAKTNYTSSTENTFQYNYNTKQIDIKSECGDDSECEGNVAGQDTVRVTPSSKPDETCAPLCINKCIQSTTSSNESNICKKTSEQASSLLAHKQVHSPQKLLTCEQCSKTFTHLKCFYNHNKRIHSEVKPFKCDQCNKAYTRLSHLTFHKKTIHLGEKPFKCEQCDIAFSQMCFLIVHQRVHSGEKPFKCEQCNKSFRVKDSLVNHKRVHTGEKPFKCDQCDKEFSAAANLYRHKRTHSGEKPFVCEHCGKTYLRSDYLISHKRTHAQV